MDKERNIKRIIGTTLAVGGVVMASWGLVDFANLEKDLESKLAERFPTVRNICTRFDRVPNWCYLETKEPSENLLEDYRNYRTSLRDCYRNRGALDLLLILQLPLTGTLGIRFLKGGDKND